MFPCSQSQKRVWFEAQLHPDDPRLNVAARWRLDGNVLDADLGAAWQLIIERHPMLRSCFQTVDGEPQNVVESAVAFHVPVVDLTTLSESDADAEAERLATEEARRAFDIACAPLIRVTHLRIRPAVSMIVVVAHQTVCDGWSLGNLAREMGEACADLGAGRRPHLPGIPVTYADYVRRERESTARGAAAVPADLRRQLQEFVPFEILPDKPRPPIQSANIDVMSVALERELTDDLAALARANGVTRFTAAFAVLAALLHHQSGQTGIVVGTQIAERDEAEFEPLVGTFVNTLVLRIDVSGNPPFGELLQRARETVTGALELRHVPLEELVAIVNPKRDLSRNALFSVNFVLQRSCIENATYGGFRLTDLPAPPAGPICDLNFSLVEHPDGRHLSCEFSADLYRRETIAAMLERFVRLLRAVVADPTIAIADLPVLSDAERRDVVALGTGTISDYGRDETVHAIFARQAARTPQFVAAIDQSAALSYAQLDRRSNQLARYLQAAGAGSQTPVGVALERSIDVPVVLLGILKAGAAYVPLDPSFPRERLAFMTEDSGVRVIITDRAVRPRLPESKVPIIDLAEAGPSIAALDDGAVAAAGGPGDTAYVMYTSGSTGRPKGVAIPHRGIARLVRATDYVEIGADDTVLLHSPLGFDLSTFEIWAPLLNGGRLAVARPGALSLADLDRTLDTFGVTTLWLTAALFREAVDGGVPAFARLRRLLAGGDVVSPVHAKRFLAAFPKCRLIDGYGPTENTTFSCCYVVPSADAVGASVPIGRPIANSSAYVLDTQLHLVPLGVVGELCVGGDGVSSGYLNLPELTAERFVADPFAGDGAARLYRTGDLARLRADGVFEFLGRLDGQVKVRGYRIELRELESVLSGHADVAGVAAIAKETTSGDKAIVAYVVPRGTTPERLDVAALRSWLGERLPAFMVPEAIVALAALPLSPNGKVDPRALPPVPRERAGPYTVDSVTEARLAAMLCDLMDRERIDRDADLFALGFHSMLAIRFAARVQAELGVELELRTLFEQPTIAAVAAKVDSPVTGSDTMPIVRLNKNGTRPPLIFFHGDLFVRGLYSRRLAAALGPDQPVYSVAPHGTEGLPLLGTVEEMARDYARRIRAVQPHGPYRLGGFCASGLVAYELAGILRAAGEVVEPVVLLNASPMPPRRIAAFDWLVARVGLNARLKANVRDSLCYNLARIHAGLVTGPAATLAVLRRFLLAGFRRSRNEDPLEPGPFELRLSPQDTKNSFAHIVSALTYHPRPHDGDVTLIWGADQATWLPDPTMGWGGVARRVEIISMAGGHVGSLSGRVEELARAFNAALGDGSATRIGTGP